MINDYEVQFDVKGREVFKNQPLYRIVDQYKRRNIIKFLWFLSFFNPAEIKMKD
jgi:hypothetical protein